MFEEEAGEGGGGGDGGLPKAGLSRLHHHQRRVLPGLSERIEKRLLSATTMV